MCRAILEGGRRCPCSSPQHRSGKDRSRYAVERVADAGAALSVDVVVAARVPVDEDAEVEALVLEYRIDADTEVDEAGAVLVKAPMAPEPVATAVLVNSYEEFRGYLGDNCRFVIVGSWRRIGGELVERDDDPEMGVERTIQRQAGKGAYLLENGSEFAPGRPEEWSFEDGLAVHTTSLGRWAYRVRASEPAALRRPRPMTPEIQARIDSAVTEITAAAERSLLAARGGPEQALADFADHFEARARAGWTLDDAEQAWRRAGDAEWRAIRDREHPALLAQEIAVNEAFAERFSTMLAFAEKRSRAFVAPGAAAGVQEHIDLLRRAAAVTLSERARLAARQARAVGGAK